MAYSESSITPERMREVCNQIERAAWQRGYDCGYREGQKFASGVNSINSAWKADDEDILD